MTGIEDLRQRPWATFDPPTDLSGPKGMVGPKERACYYWLARNWLSGKGFMVDAGAFLGASTFSFAAGAADQGIRSFNGQPVLHAYDYFKVVDRYVGEAISRDFRPIADGESYLDIFKTQTAPYGDMIAIHPGDFLSHRWDGQPVEILFIDVAKTPELNGHAADQFFPSLIPGHSVVVQQDYYHCWHPYIHIGMEYLAEEFELLDEHVPYQSAVWRLAKPIPAEKLRRVADNALSQDERLRLLDRIIAKSSPFFRPMAEVIKVWQHCLDGDFAAARALYADVDSRRNFAASDELWSTQAREVARFMMQK